MLKFLLPPSLTDKPTSPPRDSIVGEWIIKFDGDYACEGKCVFHADGRYESVFARNIYKGSWVLKGTTLTVKEECDAVPNYKMGFVVKLNSDLMSGKAKFTHFTDCPDFNFELKEKDERSGKRLR